MVFGGRIAQQRSADRVPEPASRRSPAEELNLSGPHDNSDVNWEITARDVQKILTAAQLAELNPALTEATLRRWIFNAESRGFAKCSVPIRGRV